MKKRPQYELQGKRVLVTGELLGSEAVREFGNPVGAMVQQLKQAV